MDVPPRAAKFLEAALLFTFVVHGIAMLCMAGFLLPGMPGGVHADVVSRTAYVATHPWFWRAGWFGWQLTAASDLLLAVALLSTDWISKPAAMITLFFTLLGLIPDQYGQAMWTWRGVNIARSAIVQNDYFQYSHFESTTFLLIAGFGTIGYLSAALGWTWCFAKAGTWNRWLSRLSYPTWGLFALSTSVLFLPSFHQLPPWAGKITSTGNAIAFVLLMIWLIAVTELVLRRSRPVAITAHWVPWVHPAEGMLPRMYEWVANSRFSRRVGQHLPILAMASDITDVVYINYLLPAEDLARFVPPLLKLQRLGPDQGHAMFSILSYRHGHFGPRCFGCFRRLWPSPIQSNWRIYVTDPLTELRGVHFITTAITSLPHALATRLLSEGVPMHIPASARIETDAAGTVHAEMSPGTGSAPDFLGDFIPSISQALPKPWSDCFLDWEQMLNYCVPQNRALVSQPWYGRILRQEISLNIPNSKCRPLVGKVESRAAEAIAGNAIPLCFGVQRVSFLFLGENPVD